MPLVALIAITLAEARARVEGDRELDDRRRGSRARMTAVEP